MPQLLTTITANLPPTSARTARHRLLLQWLAETPALANAFTDAQGNTTNLTWSDYSDVNPPSLGGASVASLCEISRERLNYNGPCGAGASYTVTLRLTVGMANILSAGELAGDIVALIDARLMSGPVEWPAVVYGGQSHFERFNWADSPRGQGWSYLKDIKGNDSGAPGGKVTALGIFLFEGGPV